MISRFSRHHRALNIMHSNTSFKQNNRSESDLHSCEATLAVTKKAQKKI